MAFVFGHSNGADVGAQRLGERVVAGHRVLLAAFLVDPDQPARALRFAGPSPGRIASHL